MKISDAYAQILPRQENLMSAFFFLNTENKQLRTSFCCLMLITGLQMGSSFCFLVSCSYKF